MVTLKEAVKIAERERRSKVCEIKDCNDRWAFVFECDVNCFDAIPVFVFKSDGRCEPFYVSEFLDILASGIRCEFEEDT